MKTYLSWSLALAVIAGAQALAGDDIVTTQVIGKEFPGKYKHPASFDELDNGDLYLAYFGGGGEYEELIFKICATKVGSFGIQFPITIRPPCLVTRTISLATSNGFGANMAPNMLLTRSNSRSFSAFKSVASPS